MHCSSTDLDITKSDSVSDIITVKSHNPMPQRQMALHVLWSWWFLSHISYHGMCEDMKAKRSMITCQLRISRSTRLYIFIPLTSALVVSIALTPPGIVVIYILIFINTYLFIETSGRQRLYLYCLPFYLQCLN